MSYDSFADAIEHLVSRWQQADKIILRPLFPLLAEGKPVSPRRLAELTGKDLVSVEQALINGRTSRDEEGNVTELFGIMQMPARHRIQIGQVCLFSCCALVAQMVPLLLDMTTRIESVDPISNRLVTLDISPSGIQSVVPLSTVGTLLITNQEDVLADVRSAFCTHVHHFQDAESAQEFVAKDSRRYLVTIQQFNEASRRLYTAIWGQHD
ncbi:MAG: organomercurial lyase [Geobacteraceae bacterium]|nr:organomercurial lyase [Geobacteraceae bacterium]